MLAAVISLWFSMSKFTPTQHVHNNSKTEKGSRMALFFRLKIGCWSYNQRHMTFYLWEYLLNKENLLMVLTFCEACIFNYKFPNFFFKVGIKCINCVCIKAHLMRRWSGKKLIDEKCWYLLFLSKTLCILLESEMSF